jgi:hypothetical protein
MSEAQFDLMIEILKSLQAGQLRHGQILEDVQHQLLRLREDYHNLNGNDLRIERQLAELRLDLERVNKRLGLVDV